MRCLRPRAFLVCLLFSVICAGHNYAQKGSGTKSPSEQAGLPFAWDVVKGNYATPGVSLVIREKERVRLGKSTHVTYELHAPGFVASEKPVLVRRMMNETYHRMDIPLLLDETAPAFDRSDPALLHPRNFAIGGYVLGEALDLAIFTRDGAKRAHAKVIPFPIEARGNGLCSAFAEAVVTAGRGFAVVGEGFAPGEQVRFQSEYSPVMRRTFGIKVGVGKKLVEDSLAAAADGTVYRFTEFSGTLGGTVTHTVTGSSCRVSLTHKVGKDAIEVQ